MNRGISFLVGAALLAGCGGEERAEVTSEGVIGESAQVDAPAEVRTHTALAYCDDVTTWSTEWTDFENQVLTLVNQKRTAGATCGGVSKPAVAPLTLDTRLRCAARKHSKDMGDNNFFSHTGSNGSTPFQRMTWAGYTYSYAGENIAAGYSTPSVVVTGWMNSTGHCNNIMNGNYKHLGVGYYRSATGYTHYWTQSFGAQ
ncbi:CAP domain-containing protein [Archangium lansingense]|uniref:CAP domain-containing protein n=1 Tax=Archangium lansingense TaxID=2995310 RepID=A0ABT4ABC6_9BACT|nr:CAP domain-containing protein [Archangium lansinium]MCY1078968.1 CAP domain-containing protein [Archangium lansinium]